MASEHEEVRVPLLASGDSSLLDEAGELEDDLKVHYPLKKDVYQKEKALDARSSHLQQQAYNGGLKRVSSEASNSRKKKQYTGSEMIVAVFVVAFDTKKGEPAMVWHP